MPNSYDITNNTMASVRELQQELLGLYETLDERDQRITQLEETIQRQRDDQSRLGNRRTEIERLTSDMERYRNESVRAKETIADCQARLTLSMQDNEGLREDKNQLQQQVDSQQSLLSRQQEQILQQTKALEESSSELAKFSKHQYQLELHNQKLHHSIMELEENELELVCEIEKILQERKLIQVTHSNLNSKVKQLLEQVEAHCNANHTITSKNQELTQMCDELKQHEIELQRKHQSEMDHYKIQLSRLEMDLKASMQRISSLEVENENLRSITHCAKLQAEVVQLREDLHRLQKAYDTLLSDKNQLENDLDGSCDAIQSMELKHEQDMASAIAKERTRWMRLESSSDILAKSEKVAQERVLDLQEQNDELHRQLQRARERITMYEKEYALEETSRYQKMLEADLWRREEDLRIARSQLSQEMERCKSLQHLCDRLVEKFKAAKANGSVENEFSIIEDISIHESQLEKQNEQLAKRVTELEEDQLKLMEQIRNANTRYFYAKNSTLKQKCESSTENKHPLGKNEDNLISTSSDGSPATTELSTIQHSLEALRSEFQDLQSRFSDMLITNSAPTDTVSEVFATIPPTDLMATFIREKIDELLSEKKTSSELSEFPEKQPKEGIKNIPTDSRTERRECRTDRSTSPLCTSDSTASPEFSKEHKRKTKNVGKLLRALAMCMKLIDESEQDLRERDRTIERFEESLKSMTEKVAVLSENNQELKENAKCKEGKLQQHIDQMLNEKELYIKKIVQLEQRCLDMQERAESSNSYLTLVKENLEDYKSRCEVLGVELDQHRRLTDEYMAQNNIPSLEKHNQTNLFQKSDGSVKQNLYQLLSEKDRFIKTLQAKLSETRSRLQARDFSKAEQTLKYIQAEHSEAVSMLQEIKSGFFSRSFENDYLTDARRQLYQVQQEKRFVEEKYAISVGEIDRLKRDIETLSSNMIELKGRFEKGEKQAACVKTLKAKDLEINRLRSTVRSLQKACSSKDLTVLRLETTSELEQKIKSLSDNLDKTSKSLLEHKRSKAKSDELLHKAAQRLQVAQDDITKKEVLETKLRQNLAEALSAKLNALEKARIATDKLKALQDKISTHSANMELITKQRAEIHDLNLKISSLRGLKNKKASC